MLDLEEEKKALWDLDQAWVNAGSVENVERFLSDDIVIMPPDEAIISGKEAVLKWYADFYEGFGWFGTLATISVEELYKLDLANSGLLEFTGAPVDPATHPIELTSGWNWTP